MTPAGDPGEVTRQRLRGRRVDAYARNKLYKPAFVIKADTNYAQLVGTGEACRGERRTVLHRSILIATHGTAGHLGWATPRREYRGRHGPACPGQAVRQAPGLWCDPSNCSGKELAIAPYGCDFAGDEGREKRWPSSCASPPMRERLHAGKGTGVSQCQQRGPFHG